MDGNESLGPFVVDETLIRARVLDLNIVESQGPVVLVKACAALILGVNILRVLFAFV